MNNVNSRQRRWHRFQAKIARFRWSTWWKIRRQGGERLLAVPLLLLDQYAHQDKAILDAFDRDLSWFDGVLLHGPSHQDLPAASWHPLVHRIVDKIHRKRLKLIWGRWLWPAWGSGHARDHLDTAFYRDAISNCRQEAFELQAAGTMLDVEPYGISPQITALKPVISLELARLIRSAIATATRQVGRVDYVFPPSSPRAGGFQWRLKDLGRMACEHRSYYTRPPLLVPKITPPEGVRHRVDRWGTYAHPTGAPIRISAPNVDIRLSPEEVKQLSLREIRSRYPECRGLWVYANPKDLPELMLRWSDA